MLYNLHGRPGMTVAAGRWHSLLGISFLCFLHSQTRCGSQSFRFAVEKESLVNCQLYFCWPRIVTSCQLRINCVNVNTKY